MRASRRSFQLFRRRPVSGGVRVCRTVRALGICLAVLCHAATAADVKSPVPIADPRTDPIATPVPNEVLRIQPEVLSSRADMVSGGDVLIRIPVPADIDPDDLRIYLGTTDVTQRFAPARSGDEDGLVGRLKGLQLGAVSLAVHYRGRQVGSVGMVNHPISGPVFSGPHEAPYVCQTTSFTLPGGTFLGEPLDANCSIQTRTDYFYRPATGNASSLVPLTDLGKPPADAARLTVHGKQVRHILRLETGTINRAIYQIAVLHDPFADPPVDPAVTWAGWNNRLIYAFGGGCNGGWNRQGESVGDVLNGDLIRQGYAIASSSLNVFGNNCNEILAAETMAMVKEQFVRTFGPPRFTIGWGCSGGSYQQHQIADNYPGLLDGIIAGCSFPELIASTIPSLADMNLLRRYFTKPDALPFTPAQQRATAGVVTEKVLQNADFQQGVKRIAVSGFVPSVLPRDALFDPQKNPKGLRSDVFSHLVNLMGRDPTSGFALRPLDNVGVQYGLQAFNDGVISLEQFVDLNRKIGGYNRDGVPIAERSVGDEAAIHATYRNGLVVGRGMLGATPTIDYRAYADDQPEGDLHLRYHSFALRERLIAQHGRAPNHVMFVEDMRYGLFSSESPLLRRALSEMDRWLTAIANDPVEDAPFDKAARHRPRDLHDTCMSRDVVATPSVGTMHLAQGTCAARYPTPAGPHHVAGAPIRGDIIKCQLKPVDRADYRVHLEEDALARIKQAFPTGVCDWSKPGVGQTAPANPWRRVGAL
jgi:hypothetical protein